jgi:hypothetical protein
MVEYGDGPGDMTMLDISHTSAHCAGGLNAVVGIAWWLLITRLAIFSPFKQVVFKALSNGVLPDCVLNYSSINCDSSLVEARLCLVIFRK